MTATASKRFGKAGRHNYMPNAPLREAVYEAIATRGWLWREIAAEAGMGERMLRCELGDRSNHRNHFVRHDHAVAIVRALGLDPVDFGV